MNATYLERYQQGQREQVWQELLDLGPAIRAEPLLSEARAVGREIMRRARHNIALLAERLPALSYRFRSPRRVWERPDAALLAKLDAAEREFGPLPLVLRLWFEEVGQVSFEGMHPRLSSYLPWNPPEDDPPPGDPLVLEWQKALDNSLGGPPIYTADIAPDADLKEGASGSGPISVRLPAPAFDAPLEGADIADQMYLVPYLRLCFAWGGFPGLSDEEEAAEAAQAELAFLTQDLLPI